MDRRAFLVSLVPIIQVCRNDGASVTCPPTTPSSVSATVSTVTATSTVTVGATCTVTITLRTEAGVAVPSITPTFTVSGSNNTLTQPGATNSSGVATGSFTSTTVETKTVTVMADGKELEDHPTVSVTASGSESLTLFEPAGATRLTAASGLAMNIGNWVATVPETEANPWSWVGGNPPSTYSSPWAATVTDGAAPYRTTQVGRLRGTSTNPTPPYGNGIVGKAASARMCPPGNWSSLYCAFAVKIDSSWRQYADQLKCFEWFMTSGGIIIAIDCANDNVGTPPFRFEYYNWGSSSDHEYGTSNIPLDTWVTCYCRIDDLGSSQRQRIWQKPVGGSSTLVIDATMTRTYSGNPFEFGYVNTYGGGGGPGLTPITTNIDIFFDTVYLSYVP